MSRIVLLRTVAHDLPFVCLMLLGLAAAGRAEAQSTFANQPPHITVTGEAHVEVVPDIATLSVAVATEKPKAADAVATNSAAVKTLIDELKSEGVDARDIRTVSITLIPVYDQQRDPATHTLVKQILRGYRARNSLAIKVHDLQKAGMLARQIVDKGANEVYGVSFDYEHKDEAYDKLRDAAVRDALRKAHAYLPGLGVKLGRVIEILPMSGGGGKRGVVFSGASLASSEPIAIPIEPGVQTLEIDVQVSWEILPQQP